MEPPGDTLESPGQPAAGTIVLGGVAGEGRILKSLKADQGTVRVPRLEEADAQHHIDS